MVSRLNVIYYSVALLFILTLMGLFSVAGYFLLPFGEVPGKTKSSEMYLQTVYDPSSNTTTSGFVQLGRRLKEKDFFSYFTPSGNYVIISPFGNSKYECTGSCSCLDGEDNLLRRASIAVSNSLFFILSATSVAIAVSYASKYFQDSCEQKYSSMCSEIKSDVDKCEEKKTTDGSIEGTGESKNSIPWKCMGFCTSIFELEKLMKEKAHLLPAKQRTAIAKTIHQLGTEVRKLERDGEYVPVDCGSNFLEEIVNSPKLPDAQAIFRTQHLGPYCSRIGQLPNKVDLKGNVVSMCIGDLSRTRCINLW